MDVIVWVLASDGLKSGTKFPAIIFTHCCFDVGEEEDDEVHPNLQVGTSSLTPLKSDLSAVLSTVSMISEPTLFVMASAAPL